MSAPTKQDYEDADRLLVAACNIEALEVRRWIEATKPAEPDYIITVDEPWRIIWPEPDLARQVTWGIALLLLIVAILALVA